VGYLGTNTSIDQCFKCGFKGEFKATARGFKCPPVWQLRPGNL
jgi:Oxygen-sensitive ribonucleoside-triphosphate reductase